MSSRPAIFLSCRVKVFHLQKEQESLYNRHLDIQNDKNMTGRWRENE